MVKAIAIIMSILMLSLLGVPCSDSISLQDSKIENSTPHDHKSSSTDHDNCSPLCVCNCCKSLTVYAFNSIDLAELLMPQFFDASYPLLDEKMFPATVLDIWQPPQLS